MWCIGVFLFSLFKLCACVHAYIYEAAHRGQKRESGMGSHCVCFWEPSDSSQQRQSIFLTADPFSTLHFRFYNSHEFCLTCLSYHLCVSHLWLCNKRMCTIPCVFLTLKVFSFLLCSLMTRPSHNAVLLNPTFTWIYLFLFSHERQEFVVWCDPQWSQQKVKESFDMVRGRGEWQKEKTIIIYGVNMIKARYIYMCKYCSSLKSHLK